MEETSKINNMVDEETSFLGFREMFTLCIARWRWYAVALALAFIVAFLYIKNTPPEYKRDASIMVLDGNNESSALGKMLADFTDMGFSFSDKANVSNVIAALQSPDVMRGVISTLGIDVSYSAPGTFYDATLYGKTLPLTVKFHDINSDETATLTLKFIDDGNLEISNFTKNGEILDSAPLSCKVGQTIRTPLGVLTISPTAYYAATVGKEKFIYVRKSDLNSATERFLSGLSVELADKKSTILNLSYKDKSASRAEDILNAVIDTYNEVWVKNRSRISNSTSRFIEERLAIIERELGDVDTDIANYKSKNLVPDVEKAYTLSMERADKNSAVLLDLNTRLTVAKYIREYIVDKANTNQLIPVDLGLDNDKIDEQIKNFNEIQLERNQMIANSGRQNPLVHDLDKQLSQIRRAIVYSMDNMIVSLSTRIAHLQNDEQKTNTNISANPTQAKFLLAVERQQKVKEALYLFLLQKREENELARAFNADNTQIIKSPTGNNIPISPKVSVIFIAALIVGLALPTGAIYLLEVSDTTVRCYRDVEGRVSLPFLGELPAAYANGRSISKIRAIFRLDNVAERECRILVENGRSDTINEAFRLLRANYEAKCAKEAGCCVSMITSTGIGTGKTFITANLAVSLALIGRRVLVIDGDLRHASFSSFVGNPRHGLTDCLGDLAAKAESFIIPYTKCPGLYVLPVGAQPANPAELLSSDRMKLLLADLRYNYDYVFIDCPSVGTVADTLLIAPLVDNTIFVLCAGMTQREDLPILDSLEFSERYKNMFIVLNGMSSCSNIM